MTNDVNEVFSGPRAPSLPFNAYDKNCFGRFINKTDDEVTALLYGLIGMAEQNGEYDQGIWVSVPYDDLRDALTVAFKLWQWRSESNRCSICGEANHSFEWKHGPTNVA